MKQFKLIYFSKKEKVQLNISKIKKTEILSNDDVGVKRASDIIKAGGLVALPTETVYGLGADATNPKAIDLIYKHDDFKKFFKSNEFEIMVKDLVLKVNLKKLPLSKLKLN